MPLSKKSKKTGQYTYTLHAQNKMRYYGLSRTQVEQTIQNPARAETGIVRDTVAAMSPGETKNYSEIWVLYKPVGRGEGLAIITAWRYPGKSRERDPVPQHMEEELGSIPTQER